MGISQRERSRRLVIEGTFEALSREGLVSFAGEKEQIYKEAIDKFEKHLSGKIKNLQQGEALQIMYHIDIVKPDGKVRGGSGAQRNMPEYIEWRKSVFERDGYKCVECGSTKNICAHHIERWETNPSVRFDVNNGATLCDVCHQEKHPHLKVISAMEKKNGRKSNK